MSDPMQPDHIDATTLPARRLIPAVRILDQQPELSAAGLGKVRVSAYFTSLTDAQASLLEAALGELPKIIEAVKEEALAQSAQSIREAFAISKSVFQHYREEAWAHERWHESFLQQTPCVTAEVAIERCANTPWDASDDLLVLPHQGRCYVPLFLFSTDGPPDPWWTTVLAALRNKKRHDPWDLMAWLLKPDSLLQNRSPLEVLRDDPERVISRARSATRDNEI